MKTIAYSLGNYVSNQRARKKDGGAMIELLLTKKTRKTKISKPGYYLTWVHKPIIDGKEIFKILLVKNMKKRISWDLTGFLATIIGF